jgi:thiol-disulfide isomerase/thioredoxin
MLKISIYFLFIPFIGLGQIKGKDQHPQIGKRCPDFTLKHIEYYAKEEASLKNFKGEWLILEFWSKSCVACVASFPKVNQLQKNFKDKIQFILVGKNDEKYNKNIRQLYEKFRQKENLELAVTYDSLLFDRFDIQSTPHIILIDPQSIVRAITTSSELTKDNLASLLEGGESKKKMILNFSEKEIPGKNDTYWPFQYEDKDHDTGILYRSFLSKWNRNQRIAISTVVDQQADKSVYKAACMSLKRLYTIAYLGKSDWGFYDSLYAKFWKEPILEVKESFPFQDEFRQAKGLYNYSLKVPAEKGNREYLKWAMQCDLKKYFGYDVLIETRTMPYWKLIVTDDKLINMKKSKGETYERTGDHAGIGFKNVSINGLLAAIYNYHQLEAPFINESAIDYTIDITIDALMDDLADIRKSLQKNGLDLVQGEKEIKALIIRDPKN